MSLELRLATECLNGRFLELLLEGSGRLHLGLNLGCLTKGRLRSLTQVLLELGMLFFKCGLLLLGQLIGLLRRLNRLVNWHALRRDLGLLYLGPLHLGRLEIKCLFVP